MSSFLSTIPWYFWCAVGIIPLVFFFMWYRLERGKDRILKNIAEFEGDIRFKKISNSSNFLSVHLREIAFVSDQNPDIFICKEDPINYLCKKVQARFKHLYSYKFGQNFTGIALIITFTLIGYAVYQIGYILKDPNLNVKELGNQISLLSSKFGVSVLGILCSIIYQFLSHRMASALFDKTKLDLTFLSKAGIRLHEHADLEYQRQQALGALESASSIKKIDTILLGQLHQNNVDVGEIKELLTGLQKIDVKVGDLAEGVTKQLEKMIDKSIGERLTLLLSAQKESTEKIASELGKVLAETMGKELEATFSKLAETLPNIISNGASDSSLKMSQTFEKMSETLPSLMESMNGVMIQVQSQHNDSAQSSKKINEELIQTLSSTIDRFSTLSANNTEFQSSLLSKITSTIDSVNDSSKKNSIETQQALSSSAISFGEKISDGAGLLVSSINEVKNVVFEIEKMSINLRQHNSASLTEVNNTLSSFKNASDNINRYNGEMTNSIQALLGISKQLSEAPELTKNLVIDTKKASDEITESYKNLEKMFISGVDQIASVYASKIQNIEVHAKSIQGAYEGASAGLSSALDPLEDLSENIEKLNKTIRDQTIRIGG